MSLARVSRWILAGLLLGAPGHAADRPLATSPPVAERDAKAYEGRDLASARLRDLHGVVRIRALGGLTLTDARGPWMLVRYQVRNGRDRDAVLDAARFQVRTQDGTWISAEALADHPPLPEAGVFPSARRIRVPRDQTWETFASFRTGETYDTVDPVVVYQGEPVLLIHPPRAGLEALAAEATRVIEEGGRLAKARGLLREAARAGPAAAVRLGQQLIDRAEQLRRARRPVLEDRVLRLALPYAPNRAFVHARLAELRARAREDIRPGYEGAPSPRDWRFHQRRSQRFSVARPRREVPTSLGSR